MMPVQRESSTMYVHDGSSPNNANSILGEFAALVQSKTNTVRIGTCAFVTFGSVENLRFSARSPVLSYILRSFSLAVYTESVSSLVMFEQETDTSSA